jgi:hypothetical protein
MIGRWLRLLRIGRAAAGFIAWFDSTDNQIFHRIAEEFRFCMYHSRRKDHSLAGSNSMGLARESEFPLAFKHIDGFFGVVGMLVAPAFAGIPKLGQMNVKPAGAVVRT